MPQPIPFNPIQTLLYVGLMVVLFLLIVWFIHRELLQIIKGMGSALPKEFSTQEGWYSLIGVGIVAAFLLSLALSGEISVFVSRLLGLSPMGEPLNPNMVAGCITLCFLTDTYVIFRLFPEGK